MTNPLVRRTSTDTETLSPIDIEPIVVEFKQTVQKWARWGIVFEPRQRSGGEEHFFTVSVDPRQRSGGEAPFLNCFSGSPSAKRRRGAFFALFLIDSRQRSGEIELSRRGTPSAKWWRGAFFELFLIDPRQRTGGEEASPRPGRPNRRGGLFSKFNRRGGLFPNSTAGGGL